jgi:HEAT repeat protein
LITALSNNPSKEVKKAVALALSKIGTDRAIEALIAVMDNKDSDIRQYIASILPPKEMISSRIV